RGAGTFSLEQTPTAKLHNLLAKVQAVDQRSGFRQRLEINLEMLLAGNDIAVAGELVLGRLPADRRAAQGWPIHAARREETGVSPVAKMRADLTAFVDSDGKFE